MRGRVTRAREVFEWTLRSSIRRSVRTGLRGVWVRGELAAGAAVLAPSHQSWWDGYVLREVAWQLGQPFSILMSERQLTTFPFLRLVGAIGAHELRPALRLLQAGHWLAVFPEGRIEPYGAVRRVEPGAAWLAQTSGAALIPVALRVVLRGQPRPEAYLRFGRAVTGPALAGSPASRTGRAGRRAAGQRPGTAAGGLPALHRRAEYARRATGFAFKVAGPPDPSSSLIGGRREHFAGGAGRGQRCGPHDLLRGACCLRPI